MRTPFPIRITAAGLLVTITACTTWQPWMVTRDRQEFPSRVRVTLDTGERATLDRAELHGDTLAGWTTQRSTDRRPPVLLKVPLRSVQAIEKEVFSPGRTVLLVVGGGAVIFGALYTHAILDWTGKT